MNGRNAAHSTAFAKRYASYIAYLSTRKVRDEYGNVYYGIDEDMRDRLQAKLMRAVLDYKID